MKQFLIALFVLLALPARSDEIVLGLSQDAVAITANFTGSQILIFGAVKRDSAPDPADKLGIIITVAGPSEEVTVRRIERRFGIWVNTDRVDVDAAPSFYAVASSAPLTDILKEVENLRYSIATQNAIRSVGASVSDSQEFTDALIRARQRQDLYQTLEGQVDFEEDTLFRTAIDLPSNLTEGSYATRIFLTRNGMVIDEYDTVIPVDKVGLERWLFLMSQQQSVLYGLLSLAIAGLAGWGASTLFAALRR